MTAAAWAMQPLQSLRYLAERWLILPAAAHLPLEVAMGLATLVTFADLLIPSRATSTALAEVRAATGATGHRIFPLLFERLAMPRRELVWLTRMRARRERLEHWHVVEEHRERVDPLFDSGASLILADAHFSSAAINVAQKALPVTTAFLIGEAASVAATPRERRRQIDDRSRDAARIGLLGSRGDPDRLFIGVPDVWGPGADWSDSAERAGSVRAMLKRLGEPAGIVLIRVDADWHAESGISRPFAGQACRTFALGAATIARLAQCPVVPFAAVIEGTSRTVRIIWGVPVPPPPRAASDRDPDNLERILPHLEHAIARYPAHYLAPIGAERHWDPRTRAWH